MAKTPGTGANAIQHSGSELETVLWSTVNTKHLQDTLYRSSPPSGGLADIRSADTPNIRTTGEPDICPAWQGWLTLGRTNSLMKCTACTGGRPCHFPVSAPTAQMAQDNQMARYGVNRPDNPDSNTLGLP